MRAGDIVDRRLTVRELVDVGWSIDNALEIRAVTFLLLESTAHQAERRAFAAGNITARELLEHVLPDEIKELDEHHGAIST